MRESEVEAYLVKRVKELGGEVRKLKWIGRRGAPDRFVMLFGKNFLVEVKRPGEKPTRNQLREHNFLRSQGTEVRVVDSPAAVDLLIAEKIKEAETRGK